MSEHTPTWRDLREGFAGWHETDDYGYPGIPLEESRAAADRWLKKNNARVFEEGQASVMEVDPSGEGLYHPDNPYGSPYGNVSGTTGDDG